MTKVMVVLGIVLAGLIWFAIEHHRAVKGELRRVRALLDRERVCSRTAAVEAARLASEIRRLREQETVLLQRIRELQPAPADPASFRGSMDEAVMLPSIRLYLQELKDTGSVVVNGYFFGADDELELVEVDNDYGQPCAMLRPREVEGYMRRILSGEHFGPWPDSASLREAA